MSPYRTAPVERPAQKAPRASWWRRLTHRDVERRLEIRQRRHALRARYPRATWREGQDFAEAVLDGRSTSAYLILVLLKDAATTPAPSCATPSR